MSEEELKGMLALVQREQPAIDSLAQPEGASAAPAPDVRLVIRRRALVVGELEHDLSRWGARWGELLELARRRVRDPERGARAFEGKKGENAIKNLRKKLNELQPGLADMLVERVARARYRLRVVPEVEE